MTRINTIDPRLLLDEHLIAEWREMPRIVNELRKHPNRFNKKDIPMHYTLGNGHVKFFRDKLIYLKKRHAKLCQEMDERGINRSKDVAIDFKGLCKQIAAVAMNDWTPSKADHEINIGRIAERFSLRKRSYHYLGFEVDSDDDFAIYLKLF